MPVTIPPFTDVPAPGDPVASAWAQQLTQFAVDQIVAQPGTPSSPNTELWYDTDDAGMSFPNVPRGFVGYDATSTTIANIGSTLTYLGAQVQWVADPTRRYRTTLITGRIDQFTAQSNAFAGIYDGSNNAIRYSYTPIPPGGFGFIYTFAIESGLSGTVTRKAMGSTSAGTMNVQAYTMIMVEDIGSASQSGAGGAWAITPWTAVTFQNSWANYGGGYQTCQYRKDGDMVQLRGVMTGGVASTVAFTLPVGFRPPMLIEIPGIGGGTNPRFSVATDGQVTIMGNPNFWITGQFSTVAT